MQLTFFLRENVYTCKSRDTIAAQTCWISGQWQILVKDGLKISVIITQKGPKFLLIANEYYRMYYVVHDNDNLVCTNHEYSRWHKAPCMSSSIKQYSGSHANSTIWRGRLKVWGNSSIKLWSPPLQGLYTIVMSINGYCWWGHVNNGWIQTVDW